MIANNKITVFILLINLSIELKKIRIYPHYVMKFKI